MIGDSVFDFVRPENFIYGPSFNNSVRDLTDQCGCREVNDLDNDECLYPLELSKKTIMKSVGEGYRIIFDLTHIEDLPGVLSNTGPYASKITSEELRYIKQNYNFLQNNVIFIKDYQEVEKPW